MSADAWVWCGVVLMLAGGATIAKLADQARAVERRRRVTVRWASRPGERLEFWH